jgi:hypothetical protein
LRMRGGKDNLTPLGTPDARTSTTLAKPPLLLRSTWVVVESPGPMLRRLGLACMVKLPRTDELPLDDFFAVDFEDVFFAVVFFDEELDPLDFELPELAARVVGAALGVAGLAGRVGPTAETVLPLTPMRPIANTAVAVMASATRLLRCDTRVVSRELTRANLDIGRLSKNPTVLQVRAYLFDLRKAENDSDASDLLGETDRLYAALPVQTRRASIQRSPARQ